MTVSQTNVDIQQTQERSAVPSLEALTATPKRRADVRTRTVEGETIVLDRQNGQIHQLNPTASYLWEQCDGTLTVEAMALRLVDNFAVETHTALHDVATVVAQFHTLHLLESD